MSSPSSPPPASSKTKFEKMHILVHDENGNLPPKSSAISGLFNPQQYSIDKSNQYANISIPGRDLQIIQFVRGESETLSFELFFDTYTYHNSEDVRNYTNKITNLLDIDNELHAPRICSFGWNVNEKNPYFTGIIEKATTTFTMFLADGTPVRAKLNLTVRQYQHPQPRLASPDKTKRRTFTGDPLWLIAYLEYGDPEKWKEIAIANNIVDPFAIKPGVELVIPKLDGE